MPARDVGDFIALRTQEDESLRLQTAVEAKV
jgi:hypothetical protein